MEVVCAEDCCLVILEFFFQDPIAGFVFKVNVVDDSIDFEEEEVRVTVDAIEVILGRVIVEIGELVLGMS